MLHTERGRRSHYLILVYWCFVLKCVATRRSFLIRFHLLSPQLMCHSRFICSVLVGRCITTICDVINLIRCSFCIVVFSWHKVKNKTPGLTACSYVKRDVVVGLVWWSLLIIVTVDNTYKSRYKMITRSPASAGIANRPLVFLGIFLIFGSNTPTWSVENQLHYWLLCGSHFVYGGSTHYTQD